MSEITEKRRENEHATTLRRFSLNDRSDFRLMRFLARSMQKAYKHQKLNGEDMMSARFEIFSRRLNRSESTTGVS